MSPSANYYKWTMKRRAGVISVAAVAAWVRLLAKPLMGSSSYFPLAIYRAEVLDDAAQPEVPIWSCTHEHIDPVEAHQCALDWLGMAQIAAISATEAAHLPSPELRSA